jgi:hypothetical protein
VTPISDAPSCGVTHDWHRDHSRGIIYNGNIFIIQASGLTFTGKAKSLPKRGEPENNTYSGFCGQYYKLFTAVITPRVAYFD